MRLHSEWIGVKIQKGILIGPVAPQVRDLAKYPEGHGFDSSSQLTSYITVEPFNKALNPNYSRGVISLWTRTQYSEVPIF